MVPSTGTAIKAYTSSRAGAIVVVDGDGDGDDGVGATDPTVGPASSLRCRL